MSDQRKAKKQTPYRRATGGAANRGLWLTGGLIVVVAAMVTYSLFATGLVGGGGTSMGAKPAPDVSLATIDGQVRLSDLRGQPLLLYFSFPG